MRHLFLLLPLALAASCAHQQEAKRDQPPAATSVAAASPRPTPSVPAEASCSNDLACGDRQLCIRGRCVDVEGGLAECRQVLVHFALDSAQFDDSEKRGLDRAARCLKADHALHVTIDGNADERGTEEYNLALGDRRATAVARYLEALGVSTSQLRTVSYGNEKPLCTEHDEECWAKNRRADVDLAPATSAAKERKGKR